MYRLQNLQLTLTQPYQSHAGPTFYCHSAVNSMILALHDFFRLPRGGNVLRHLQEIWPLVLLLLRFAESTSALDFLLPQRVLVVRFGGGREEDGDVAAEAVVLVAVPSNVATMSRKQVMHESSSKEDGTSRHRLCKCETSQGFSNNAVDGVVGAVAESVALVPPVP